MKCFLYFKVKLGELIQVLFILALMVNNIVLSVEAEYHSGYSVSDPTVKTSVRVPSKCALLSYITDYFIIYT